ncbi:hypothetical protein DQ384_17415 [Sphaerisporangium album]|uniref:DUF5666 domain-containing protein n=1 Tax=Sphaerisporangium album TaxID=509200 RepID=A0A367FJD9_9ACTN|nr:hypothetical protein [Sphaerisporangium album]RCG29942.1 hypothetical protein DQ384_17415 [Sphaerisporangium album]
MITKISRIGRMSLLPAAALVAFVPATASATPLPEVPAVSAFDGGKPLASAGKAVRRCAERPRSCRFAIDAAASGEYYSAVKSLGNAVINCTLDEIKVTRQVTLRTSSSDNLGGEITGKISAEGTINGSGELSAGVNAEGSGSFDTPNKQQGPSATVGAKAGANGSGKITGSLGVKGAFEGAFRLQYQRTWTTEQTESTSYDVTVRSGDVLTFGASSAMQRIAGTLTVGGLKVRNVAVDGPSSVNTSTFVADTFTAPGGTCQRLRPQGRTAADDTPKRLARGTGGLTELPAVPPGARLREHVVFAAERP